MTVIDWITVGILVPVYVYTLREAVLMGRARRRYVLLQARYAGRLRARSEFMRLLCDAAAAHRRPVPAELPATAPTSDLAQAWDAKRRAERRAAKAARHQEAVRERAEAARAKGAR